VRCPNVCPPVFPVRRLLQRAAGLLLLARRVGEIGGLLHVRRAAAQGRRTARSSECSQCHFFSVRT